MRQRVYLNDNWEFTREWTEDFGHIWKAEDKNGQGGYGDNEKGSYEIVRLPHTCRETPFHYFDESVYQMVCGYRQLIRGPQEWQDKRILLTIEAAGHEAEVWLNGKMIAKHSCGYTAFSVELQDHMCFDEDNLLAIRVDSRESLNVPPFGFVIDYMTYGGLYREVWLDITEKECITDVFVRPEIPQGERLLHHIPEEMLQAGFAANVRFTGCVKSEVQLAGIPQRMQSHAEKPESSGKTDSEEISQETDSEQISQETGREEMPLCINQTVLEKGEVLVTKLFDPEDCVRRERRTLDGAQEAVVLEMPVPEAKLWDVLCPHLYQLRTELISGEEVIDVVETTFGFRRAEFTTDGFYLNRRKLKLCGLNRHQSYPFVGYAMPRSQQERDADILKKELGLNAVRTSHYPQSQYFIDRCDAIGLLVFTEIPGWQHIGDEAWKEQAVRNTQEMVLQYRNHPSVFLWGVRINESADDDGFYSRTNQIARELDETRAKGGVRCSRNSSLLEDVYTYNDFSHDGTNAGCEPKEKVTSDPHKAYLVTEYNGHMYPTKAYDSELHRRDHALRHARVLNDIALQEDIAGSFGWCFADYNTHQDFGSGDRICYHGVMDMFRNPKLAAAVYASRQEETPVLEVSSSMDIGEHPAGNQDRIYIFTNADQVRMYKNDRLLKTYETGKPDGREVKQKTGNTKNTEFRGLIHPPVEIDDFVGDAVECGENFTKKQAALVKDLLNYGAVHGFSHMSPRILAKAAVLMKRYHMTFEDAYRLFGKYIGSWGGTATSYRFEAIRNGEVVKTLIKSPVKQIHLQAEADHTKLQEDSTYDVAAIRLSMRDQNGNVLPFYQGSVRLEAEGPIRIIGPETAQLRGGLGGTYIRTTGETGEATVMLTVDQAEPVKLAFCVR